MTRAVLTAVSHRWEADLVTSLEASAGLTVVRRCADVADLLAAASAGLADLAIVSADLRALDRDALHHLARHGVRAAGAAPGDEPGERRLRQLGLDVVVRSDAETHELEEALAGLDDTSGGDCGPRRRRRPGRPRRPPPRRSGGPLRGGEPGAAQDQAADPDAWRPVEECRVIAVWGPAGAPGRTTVALGLAAEPRPPRFASPPRRRRHLRLLHRPVARPARRGAGDGRRRPRRRPRVTRPAVAGPGGLGGRALAGEGAHRHPTTGPVARSCGRRGRERPHGRPAARRVRRGRLRILDRGRRGARYTLAPRRNAATLTALEQADELVVVGSADLIGLQRLVRAVQDVGSVPSPTPRVVVNKLRASSVGSHPERRVTEALGRFAGMEDLHFLLGPGVPGRRDVRGVLLTEFAPHSELRRAIAALASRYAAVPEPARRGRRRR